MSRARAARSAAVGTNGLLLVAAWITVPAAMWPVRAAAALHARRNGACRIAWHRRIEPGKHQRHRGHGY